MAALDDELNSDLPGYTPTRSVYETGEAPAVSALDGETPPEDEEVGYGGGGGDDLVGASATLARLRPAPAGSPRAVLRQVLEQRLAERAAAPAASAGFGVIGRDPEALRRMIVPDAGEVIYSRPETEKPPEERTWTSILGRGLLRANEGLMQGKDIAEGKKPRTSKTEQAEYEKPMELADFLSPTTLAEKTVFGLAASYPAVALSIAGGFAGGAIGTAVSAPTVVGTPVGATIGTVVGGAAGMGLGAAFQELGPAYHAELEALGPSPTQEGIDKAWDNALVQVGKTGVVNAASMALLSAGKPLSNALKGLWTPAIKKAAGPVVAGVPTRVGVQVAGQPAIAVGGEAAANVVQGKPITENLDPAAAGSIANVAADVAAMAGGRLARGVGRRIMRGREGEVTPGVSDDQAAALEATQPPNRGPGPGPIPPPVTPTPPGLPPAPDNLPPPRGGVPPQDNLPPPQDNLPPPQDNLPPPPVRPDTGIPNLVTLPDTTGLETNLQRPPVPPPITETSAPPPRDTGPPRAGPVAGETIVPDTTGLETNLQPTRRPPPEGGGVPPEPPPPPPPPPVGPLGPSRLQERVGTAPPEPAPAPVPTGGPRSRIQERYGTEGVGERTVTHVEPDDVNAGQFVAKGGGEVIGKGASPEEALADARARQGAPYAEEAPAGAAAPEATAQPRTAEQAKPAATGTKDQPVSAAERAPPAQEAAKPETAASGRDAVPETPSEQTFTLPKTGHKLTGRQNLGTADPARPFVLSWTRGLLDAQGRPVRGATHKFDYADEASARADAAAVREAGGKDVSLREFSPDGKARVVDTAEEVKAKGKAKKAVSEEKAAEVKAKGEARAKPPQGERDVTQEVREGVLTDAEDATRTRALDEFEKNLGRTLAERKGSDTARNNERVRQLDAWEAGFDAGLRELSTPESVGNNVVTSFRAGREAGRGIREGRVTKTTESGAQKPAPKTETVTKPNGDTEKVAPTRGGGVGGSSLAGPMRTSREPAQGTRTKSGAYTMGEGEDVTPKRGAPTQLQQDLSNEARIKRQRGLVSTATRRMAEVEAVPEPYPVTPGLESGRRARSVVKNILAGQSLADALVAFGTRKPSTPGPKPKFETLSQYIREDLKNTTPEAEAKLRESLDKTAKQLKEAGDEASSERREEILENITEHLEHLDRIKGNRAFLEDAVTQIEALEAGARGPKSIRRWITELVSRSNIPFEYLAKRREVNEPILRHIEQAGDAGAPLHVLLDDFVANKNAAGMTPQLVELAGILRRVVPDTKVRQGEGIIPYEAVGTYDPVKREIYLDTNIAREEGNAAVTLLHETIHRPTVEYINHLYTTPEANLNPRELAHRTALEAIRAEVHRVYSEGGLRTEAENFELGYATHMYYTDSLTGPHELATQLLTQPEIHRFLSRETASPEFRAALEHVGMGISQKASIWDGFKKIVRNIFGVPDKLDSVFDYVLRPLTEIVETGAKFRRPGDAAEANRITRQNNDVLGPAKLRTEASKKWLGDAFTNFYERGGRTVMRAGFHGATFDAIHDFIKPYVPSVTAHRDALESVVRTIGQERTRDYTTYTEDGRAVTEPHVDKSARLADEMRTRPDGDAVQELMTDATMAKADLIDPKADNSHVNPDVLRDLMERHADLSPETRNTYRESNQVYNERDRAEREARVRQVAEAAYPEMTRAQHDDIVQHMSTQAGIEDILTNLDRSALVQRLGPRAANSVDLLKLLAESERGGFVKGNYFPANRFGEYVISAGEVGKPNYVVQMFERPSEAKEFKRKLELDRSDVSQMFIKSDANFTQSMPGMDRALGTFDLALEKAGITGDHAKTVRDMYAGQLIQQGMRLATNSMKREYVSGASNQQARNMMQDFLAHTTRMGHLAHQGEVVRTLYQAEKEAKMLHQPGQGPNLDKDGRPRPQASAAQVAVAQLGTQEMRRRLTSVDGDNSADQMGRGVRAVTGITVVDNLIRPAHLFMTIAGTHAFALSMIGGKHGAVASTVALTKAYAQLTGTMGKAAGRNMAAAYNNELKAANWDMGVVYRRRLERAGDITPEHANLLMDTLEQSNLVNQTRSREVQRMAGRDGWISHNGPIGAAARSLDIFAAGEHAIESALRVGSAKAGFVMELRRNGGDVQGALDFAKQVARKSMPDWNMYNKPRLTTRQGLLGQFGAITTQFKGFGLHSYGVQGNLIAESYRNARGSVERREALKTLALLHGSHALMWGGVGASVFGGVPMMLGMGLYDAFSGDERPHTNREWENWARNYVHNVTGSKTAADVYQYGLPAAVGINTSSSLRFSNMLQIPEWKTNNAKGAWDFATDLMMGAGGKTTTKLGGTVLSILQGDTRWETMASLLPRIIEDPIKAGFLATKGLKNPAGDRVILPPEKFSTFDLAAKGVGFNLENTSTAQNARSDITLAEQRREDIHGHYLRKLVQSSQGSKERSAALAEIMRYNNSVPNHMKITAQEIQSRIKQQAVANAQPSLYGMQVPRRQYGKVEELTAYARP